MPQGYGWSSKIVTWHTRLIFYLWVAVVTLIILYGVFRWGHPGHGSPQPFPGSD